MLVVAKKGRRGHRRIDHMLHFPFRSVGVNLHADFADHARSEMEGNSVLGAAGKRVVLDMLHDVFEAGEAAMIVYSGLAEMDGFGSQSVRG